MNARELALDVFCEMEKTGVYGNVLIGNVLDKYDYEDPREKAFFKRLTEGTLERRITLDWVLDCFSKTPVQKMKPLIRSLLRLSAYQILYMESVPDSAACNEAVKLAKKRGFSSLAGFVNGVLRSISRSRDRLPWPDPEKDAVKSMSVRSSLPEWIVELWLAQYGQEQTEAMLEGLEKQRPLIIRFAESLSEEEVLKAVSAILRTGVEVSAHPLCAKAFALDGCEGVTSLPGFAEGLFYAQDVSSMLAVETAGIRPGMNVLDLCSAPGGKAILAWEKLGAGGNIAGAVKAGDVSEAKIARIRENAARMGAAAVKACSQPTTAAALQERPGSCRNVSMEISVWDARRHMEELDGWADVMLADLPCSGLGVMGRKKDIRYRVKREDLDSLISLQKEILEASWRYVKPGGILLYSTCTVDRMENEEMVRFLTENFPFETESLDPWLPEQLRNADTAGGCCQLFGGLQDTDGFFMARLRRKQ